MKAASLVFISYLLYFASAAILQNISEGLSKSLERIRRTFSPPFVDSITSRAITSPDPRAYAAYLKKCTSKDTIFEQLEYDADEYQSEECVKRAIDVGNVQLVADLINHDYRGHSYAQGIVNYAALNDNLTMLADIFKELQSKGRDYQTIARNAIGLARRTETKEYLDKYAEV